jgi:hypothetical protein
MWQRGPSTPDSTKRLSLVLRIAGAALFALGGACLVLMSLLGAPSFWYYPCFYALILIAPLWAWRPRVGAGLAVGPLVAVIAQARFLSGLTLVCTIGCVIVALSCMWFGLKEPGSFRMPVIISLSLLSMSFLTDRLFTGKVVIRSYQVQVALDGNTPWGTVGPEWSDSLKPVVLYRRVGDTYCYVAFHSLELRDRLAHSNGASVRMQVNIFKDFGAERGYNVRSVDGLLLANGPVVVRDAERFGGQMLGVSGATPNCW